MAESASRRRALAATAAATALALALTAGPAPAQEPDDCFAGHGNLLGSSVSREGPHAIGRGEAFDLQSAYDGETIQVAVIRPQVPEGTRVPVIVFATPYMFQNLHDGCFGYGFDDLVLNFVPHGYAVGVVAVRGTADSGGCSDLMGPAERADVDQAISWFGTQPWSSGSVGMIGVSYDGSTPWEVAAAGNPHLKTIVPISGVSDVYALMFGRGVNELRGPVLLGAIYWLDGWLFINPVTGNRSPEHTAGALLCPEVVRGFGASLEAAVTGERDSTGFWAERTSRPGVEADYRGSILLARGLQDWNVDPSHDFPWVTELERRGLHVQYLLGQWGHAWPDINDRDRERADWADLLLAWWDRWLKADPTADAGPRAQVQDSALQWREEDAWPPVRASERRLYLAPDGSLADAPPDEVGTALLAPDPRNEAGETVCAATCAAFELTAERELRLSGIPRVQLVATPTGPGGHIGAWLYGGDELIGWGQADLRFPHGGEQAATPAPNQPVAVTLSLEPLDAVVPAGDTLRLVLSQSWYGDHIPSVPTYPVRVETGRNALFAFPSLEVEPCRFFAAPTGAGESRRRAVRRSRRRGRLRARRQPGVDPPRAELRVPPLRGTCTPPPAPAAPAPATLPVDRRPAVTLTRLARRLRALKRIGGRARDDRGLARVEVALARRVGRRCAYLRRDGRLGRPGSCRPHRAMIVVRGTSRWRLRLPRRLPRGRYELAAQAIDSGGQVSRLTVARFRIG